MAFTQQDRLLSISTVLGDDVLLLTELSGEEGISRSFRFEMSLLSEQHAISCESLLGSNVTVSIALADGNRRYLNGIISTFSQGRTASEEGEDARFSSFRCNVVPWFWCLSESANIRIFQNLSTPEIVERVFADHGFSWYQLQLRGSYEKREFCVQYRETDFNFVSRLLEEEGISYFFRHEKGRHTMVLADSPDAHLPCPFQRKASCLISASGTREEDVITSLDISRQLRSTTYSLNDYNFMVPRTSLKVQSNTPGHSGTIREVYDVPGGYEQLAQGERLAKIRMEEEEARSVIVTGGSDCRAFVSGYRFILTGHGNANLDGKDLLLVSVRHDAMEGYGTDEPSSYRNSFDCIPYHTPYRPPRLTPKPVLQGAQTAVVVGPPGEEIHTDQYGRVKVQFHWDREGKRDDKSSCWIRVSQPWAGSGWGALFLPRVGQEVVVDFLGGDPDRPIVIGQLHNGQNLPPYQLPLQKTRSCIKSCSTPEGGGYNELCFEDKKGEEQLYIHAQREQVTRVEEDLLEWVGQDRHLVVNRDRLEKVSRDQHLEVLGDCNEKIDGTLSVSVGADLQLKVEATCALQAGELIQIKAAKNVVVESSTQLSLKVGDNFINISAAGVTIVGKMVLINSGGLPAFCTGASPEHPKPPKEAGGAGAASTGATQVADISQANPQTRSFERANAVHTPLCDR
ncbi:type VI secretion system Vgr family protein [Geomonas ferrireducens]|uniref:type VI secretion system Vgr family protein n=1 Tax=Geomonas ferrireducens TaxID=2570227 RepID=UPI0010A82F31|nr:type VI secretion system tip protein VgrG [Geomonas ferrireducens]